MAQVKLIQGIVGGLQKSDLPNLAKSECDNMYYEKQKDQASVPAVLRSVSGTSVYLELPESNCRGTFRCSRGRSGSPTLYAVYGTSLYLITEVNGVPNYTMIGSLSSGVNTPVRMCETGGYGDAHPHLIIVDGAGCFAVDTTLLPMQQRADYKALDLPLRAATQDKLIKPTHCAYMYGYLVVNDSETDASYLSYQYPFEITDPVSGAYNMDIFQKEKYNGYGFAFYSEWMTDTTLAIASTGANLWTFGPRSYQVFSYMDDLNYPFQSSNTAGEAIGIRAISSLATVGDLLFFLGASDVGQNGIYMGSEGSLTRISDYDIERYIESLDSPEDAIAQCWQENRHIFYAITFVTAKRTFVYDVTENIWHTRSSYDQSQEGNKGLWRPQFAVFAYNKIIFGIRDDNKLVYLDNTRSKEYDDLVLVKSRVSAVVLADFSPWFCTYLRLICNNGQTEDPNLMPQVTMQCSWDGGMEWSDQEVGLIGEAGQYWFRTEWFNLGYGEVLNVRFSCSDNFNFCILSAKIGAEPTSIY